MTAAHMIGFAEIVANSPDLQEKLHWRQTIAVAPINKASAPWFIASAVKEAVTHGFVITEAEAVDWLNTAALAASQEELTDVALDAVAGGTVNYFKGEGEYAGFTAAYNTVTRE